MMFTKVFAHRGASGHAPENTMPAFQLAYQMGADGIETDVHLTKDKIPVLFHDEQVKRTTNGRGFIKDLTVKQLKTLDAGSWFSTRFSGTTITTLEEFLSWVKNKPLRINIELKNNKIDYQHLESKVYEMVEAFQLQERTLYSTFNPNSLKRLKKWHPKSKRAFLTSKRSKHLIKFAKELDVHGLHVKYQLLTRQLVQRAHQKDLAVRVYTVNRTNRIVNCLRYKCNGLFTDFPDLALKIQQTYGE